MRKPAASGPTERAFMRAHDAPLPEPRMTNGSDLDEINRRIDGGADFVTDQHGTIGIGHPPASRVILPADATPRMVGNVYPAVVAAAPAQGRWTPQDTEIAAEALWEDVSESGLINAAPWRNLHPAHKDLWRRSAVAMAIALGFSVEETS